MSDTTAVKAAPRRERPLARTVVTAMIGQALEWYDFYLYGTAAVLVFGQAFFPISHNPLIGIIASFGGFTLGFVARPVGAILCGHLGDRIGRKKVLTLTLFTMGVATFLMGVLPTYQTIGLAAPVLLVLLRIMQGLAAGGETTGSVLMIAESAGSERRAFFSSFSPAGAALGFLLSSAAFLLVQSLPHDDFMAWGWRLPFLASFLIVLLGVYMRLKLAETAEFQKAATTGKTVRAPLLEVFRHHPKPFLQVMGLRLGEGSASYLLLVFSLVYGRYLHISNGVMLAIMTGAMALLIPSILFFGNLSDRLGRRTIYRFGSIGIIVVAFPFFWLMRTTEPWAIALGFFLAIVVVYGALQGSQPALFSELFSSASVRYSGLGTARELASVIGGGIAPGVATALLSYYQSIWPVAIYLAAMGLITTITIFLTPETHPAKR